MFAIAYPHFDPVALSLGPLPIRWYALMYILGIGAGWKIGMYLLKTYKNGLEGRYLEDSLTYLIPGILIGGRLGHVFFYAPHLIWTDPLEIFKTWNGGMSFHGGLAGVIVALFLFVRARGLSFLTLTDIYACVAPIGLLCGRLGNFINGELWGRVTTVPWAMVFPYGGPLPRHPSQLYELLTEGILLFLITYYCWCYTKLRHKPGRLTGIFTLGYGVARIFCEFFREPEIFVIGNITMGQFLSLPLIGLGWFLLRRPVVSHADTTHS